jgi:SWI/SNF-related matrix-associated actin-dependent regulator 1 of chromatin subfamily A
MIHTDLLMKDVDKNDSLLQAAWDTYSGGGEDRSSFSTAKAVNALAKVPYTVEFVTDLLDQAPGVVVFSDHIQAAQSIAAQIPGARFITGATDVKTRDALVQDLNHGRLRVLVATIGALSVGVDITGVNYMVFNDFAWVEADMEQARKRIHRIGQTETCFFYYVLSSKVDEYIFNTLKQKQKIMEVLEGIGH